MSSDWGWTSSSWGWGTDEDASTSQVIARLAAEFAELADADMIAATVRQARAQVGTAETPALPEAVEELARRLLQDTTGAYTITGLAKTGMAAGSSVRVVLRQLRE